MKNLFVRLSIFGAVVFLSLSCEPEIDKEAARGNISAGDASFSNFLAVGGSYASGIADAELYRSGQENSFSAILAGQLQKVSGGIFKQPLMFDELGFGNRRKLARRVDCEGTEELVPVLYSEESSSANSTNIAIAGPFNNTAVPGARMIDLNLANYSHVNPYFARFASSQVSSIMDESTRQPPSFFTLWAGENDVLLYAIDGGGRTLQGLQLTPLPDFDTALATTLRKLTATGARGVIANIPDVESMPYFNVIPYDNLVLTASEAARLNLFYIAQPNITFKEGRNAMVIIDGLRVRQMVPGEKVVLTLDRDSVKCHGYGSYIPLPDREVLTAEELTEIKQAVQAFNSLIEGQALKYGLAYFDAWAFFKKLSTTGIVRDGVHYDNTYVKGGFYSLDGLHPTPRGNALLANEAIDLINLRFRSGVPRVNVNQYPTVPIP